MLIEPTTTELARNRDAATRVVVTVDSRHRILDPSRDGLEFGQAAALALDSAQGAGYDTIAFASVAELITREDFTAGLIYRYVWEFTAHRPS